MSRKLWRRGVRGKSHVILLPTIPRHRFFFTLTLYLHSGHCEAELGKYKDTSQGDDGAQDPEDHGYANAAGSLHHYGRSLEYASP